MHRGSSVQEDGYVCCSWTQEDCRALVRCFAMAERICGSKTERHRNDIPVALQRLQMSSGQTSEARIPDMASDVT